MPKNDAERVVTGARHLSPYLGDRMVPATLLGRHVVVRELRPQDLKFEFSELTQDEAIMTARLLAGVVGKAHGRQMKAKERKSWSRLLKTSYTAFSLAPLIILFLSVVSLFMKRDDAARRIVAQISDLVGVEGGKVVEEILSHAGTPPPSRGALR